MSGVISSAARTGNIYTQLTFIGGNGPQGLEGAGSFLGCTNRLEVQGQGGVVAHIGEEATFLLLGIGHLLLFQLIQLLHRF